MNKFLIIFLFSFFLSCSSNKIKTVLVCGDHICINKKEAQQYFEENLTLEVKIIDQFKENDISLVELNLKNKSTSKEINIFKKDKTSKKIKKLTNIEVEKIKANIKKKDKRKKIVKKTINKKETKKKLKILNDNNLQKSSKKTSKLIINKEKNNFIDICTILDKCNIDEISEYLIKEGKAKDFPDITIRE